MCVQGACRGVRAEGTIRVHAPSWLCLWGPRLVSYDARLLWGHTQETPPPPPPELGPACTLHGCLGLNKLSGLAKPEPAHPTAQVGVAEEGHCGDQGTCSTAPQSYSLDTGVSPQYVPRVAGPALARSSADQWARAVQLHALTLGFHIRSNGLRARHAMKHGS